MSFILIDRKLFNHFLWTENRSLSRFEAWIDLIQLASFTHKNERLINGVLVKWDRGQIPVSYSFLMKRWNWSANRVRGYLSMLKNNKQINTRTTSVTTILTLCNYEQYNIKQQAGGQAKGITDGNSEGQADDKRKAGSIINKEVKEDKLSNVSDKPTDFLDRIIDEFVKAHGNYEILNPGKERAAAGKILSHYKQKYPNSTSEETLAGLRTYFDACVSIEDNWLRENMSLSIIINKFNEINNILKNGKHKGSGATNKELAELLINKFGVSH